MRIFTACFAVVVFSALSLRSVLAEPSGDTSRVLVVLAFDQTCKKWCSVVRPMVEKLKQEYHDRVDFAELDFTQSELPNTTRLGKELGIGKVIEDAGQYVPEVLVFAAKRKLVKELDYSKGEADYRRAIDDALRRSSAK